MNSVRLWLLLTGLLFAQFAFSQNSNIDSLKDLLASKSLIDTSKVDVLNQLAFQNYYNNPVNALRYAYQARDLSDSIHYLKGYAESLRQIGLVAWALADYTAAMNYFLSGLKVAENQKLLQQEADLLGNIGLVYNGMGNPTEALNFLEQSRKLQQQLNNKWREAAIMNNVGDAYLSLKNFKEAINAYSFALNTSKNENYLLGVSTNIRNIGNVYEAMGDFDTALQHYQRCIKLSDSIQDNRGLILSNKSMSSTYFKLKKYTRAEKFALNGLQIAEANNLRAFMRDLYGLLYEINESQGKLRESIFYLKKYSAYKDSIQNAKVASDVAAQRLTYETDKKQAEINLLKKDSELQLQKLEAKNRQLIFIVIILLLFALLLFIVIRNTNRLKSINDLLKKKNREIDDQKREIAKQRDELITLNEEIISQQDEVVAQRDALEIKNKEIEEAHKKIKSTNDNLERIIAERTASLMRQNKSLSEYAFFNAHKLRAPLASILGLIELLNSATPPEEQGQILNHLRKSSIQLDQVVKSISKTLDEGIEPIE
jgi:tetratricopeptide (TPR) repeat protein